MLIYCFAIWEASASWMHLMQWQPWTFLYMPTVHVWKAWTSLISHCKLTLLVKPDR